MTTIISLILLFIPMARLKLLCHIGLYINKALAPLQVQPHRDAKIKVFIPQSY